MKHCIQHLFEDFWKWEWGNIQWMSIQVDEARTSFWIWMKHGKTCDAFKLCRFDIKVMFQCLFSQSFNWWSISVMIMLEHFLGLIIKLIIINSSRLEESLFCFYWRQILTSSHFKTLQTLIYSIVGMGNKYNKGMFGTWAQVLFVWNRANSNRFVWNKTLSIRLFYK